MFRLSFSENNDHVFFTVHLRWMRKISSHDQVRLSYACLALHVELTHVNVILLSFGTHS